MNRENFFRKFDKIVGQFGDTKPGILLHSCCGPCSSSVLELLSKYFDVTVLWYNPNLYPEAEYEKRLATQKQLINAIATKINGILEDAANREGAADVSSYLRDENGNPYQLFQKSIDAGDWTVSNMVINADLRQNPTLLSFRLSDHSEDNETMEKLKTAFSESVYTLNPNVQTPVNFVNYYKNLVGQVANSAYVFRGVQESQTVTTDALFSAREQIVGVSSDDELTNMIMYQNAYNASSRYINVISEMLEHILTTLGR